MKNFYDVKSFCDHLAKLFKRVTPIAGKGIKIEDTDNGKRISLDGEITGKTGGAASVELGYFTVIDISTEEQSKIKVIDGADEESEICGWMFAFDAEIDFAVAELVVPGNDQTYYTCRKIVYSDGQYSGTIEIKNSRPLQSDSAYYSIIARVIRKAGTINIIPEKYANEVIGRTV